jgi:hypothetical protein
MPPVRALGLLAVAAATAFAGLGCEKRPTAEPSPPLVVPSAAPVVAGASADPARDGGAHPQFARVEFPEVPIRAGTTTTVKVIWRTPTGTGVNEDAPFRVRWDRSDALAEAPADVKATGTTAREGFRIAVKPLDGAPNATLGGVIDIVVCDVATHSVCVPVRRKVEIDFVVGKAAAAETTVTVDLPQARVL